MALPVNEKQWRFILALSLIIGGVLLRLLPHEPNFAPVGAIALFGGVMLGARYGLLLPLGILMISDVVLGLYDSIAFTWLAFLLVALLGARLRRSNLVWQIGLGSFSATMLFFVVSNFGTWLTSGMYAHTLAGLAECYTLALPFLRTTLLSDTFYAVMLFGAYYVAIYTARKYAPKKQPSGISS